MAKTENPNAKPDSPIPERDRKAEKAAERAARQSQNRAEREARRLARQAERQSQRANTHAEPQTQNPRMVVPDAAAPSFNILIVAQRGRLAFEAALFCASLRRNAPGWTGRLIVAEPLEEGEWAGAKIRLTAPERALIESQGGEITPFRARHFGRAYPYGNKIEALALLPAGEPFIFFDSDTVVTGPLDKMQIDFSRPTASMRRTGTWPQPPLYGPGYSDIWKSLYDRFGLEFTSSLDKTQPDEHWERYLYFNAGWFLGPDPQEFGRRFLEYALEIQANPGEELACQSVEVLLDQVALPLVIHSLGGGRPGPELAGLDGDVTCHYRDLALAYARESDKVIETLEKLLSQPALGPTLQDFPHAVEMVLKGVGREQVRPIFDRSTDLNEGRTRHILKKMGLWQR